MEIKSISLAKLTPYPRNPRQISERAVESVMSSLAQYGWRQPIVAKGNGEIVVGHTRYDAAQRLNAQKVSIPNWKDGSRAPVLSADDLTEDQIRAYRIADNRTGEESSWDMELLGVELEALKGNDFDLALTGFAAEELVGLVADGFFEATSPLLESNVKTTTCPKCGHEFES